MAYCWDYSPLKPTPVIEMPVEPGDKVVLFTDGIVETESPSEQEFGLDLFKGFLESNHHLKANLFADALLDRVIRTGPNILKDKDRRTT